MNTLELRQQRGEMITQMRGLLDKAETEKRNLTAEEEQVYARIEKDEIALSTRIEREEKVAGLEKEVKELIHAAVRPPVGAPAKPGNRFATPEYAAAFNAGMFGHLIPEMRAALQADDAVGGGYLVAPEQLVVELLKAVDDAVVIRQLARKFQVTSAESLGVLTQTAGLDDAEWTPEIVAAPEDTSLRFGKRELHPHQIAKRVKLSNQLIRKAIIPPATIVRDELARVFALTEEKAFLTGTGAQQPLGIFTADDNGIGTARDVVTGSATNFTGDGLIDAQGTLKVQYQANARWLTSRPGMTKVRKLKDGNGNYLWQPGLQSGVTDLLLGKPVVVSENVPSTFTNGLYVAMYGDFSKYYIADALNMQIQVLDQLYAETNQTGFIARAEVDGQPVMAEAFVRLKTGV